MPKKPRRSLRAPNLLLADLIELLGPDETSRKAVAGQVFRSAGGGVRQYRAPAGYVAVPVPVPGCAVPQYRRATKKEIEEAVEAAKKAEGLAPKPARKPGKTAKKAVAKAAKKAKKQAAKAKRRGVPPPRPAPAPAPAPANVANLPMVPPVAPPSPSRTKERAREQAEQEAREKAREKAEQAERERAEREARERAEREQAERAERQAREQAERQARVQAEREQAERQALEQAERERAQRQAEQARVQAEREQAERQALEQAERERAEREQAQRQAEQARVQAEREAREQAEREARERAEREAREQAEREQTGEERNLRLVKDAEERKDRKTRQAVALIATPSSYTSFKKMPFQEAVETAERLGMGIVNREDATKFPKVEAGKWAEWIEKKKHPADIAFSSPLEKEAFHQIYGRYAKARPILVVKDRYAPTKGKVVFAYPDNPAALTSKAGEYAAAMAENVTDYRDLIRASEEGPKTLDVQGVLDFYRKMKGIVGRTYERNLSLPEEVRLSVYDYKNMEDIARNDLEISYNSAVAKLLVLGKLDAGELDLGGSESELRRAAQENGKIEDLLKESDAGRLATYARYITGGETGREYDIGADQAWREYARWLREAATQRRIAAEKQIESKEKGNKYDWRSDALAQARIFREVAKMEGNLQNRFQIESFVELFQDAGAGNDKTATEESFKALKLRALDLLTPRTAPIWGRERALIADDAIRIASGLDVAQSALRKRKETVENLSVAQGRLVTGEEAAQKVREKQKKESEYQRQEIARIAEGEAAAQEAEQAEKDLREAREKGTPIRGDEEAFSLKAAFDSVFGYRQSPRTYEEAAAQFESAMARSAKRLSEKAKELESTGRALSAGQKIEKKDLPKFDQIEVGLSEKAEEGWNLAARNLPTRKGVGAFFYDLNGPRSLSDMRGARAEYLRAYEPIGQTLLAPEENPPVSEEDVANFERLSIRTINPTEMKSSIGPTIPLEIARERLLTFVGEGATLSQIHAKNGYAYGADGNRIARSKVMGSSPVRSYPDAEKIIDNARSKVSSQGAVYNFDAETLRAMAEIAEKYARHEGRETAEMILSPGEKGPLTVIGDGKFQTKKELLSTPKWTIESFDAAMEAPSIEALGLKVGGKTLAQGNRRDDVWKSIMDLRQTFNAKFIRDAIGGYEGTVSIGFAGKKEPIVIEKLDGETHLIAPMVVTDEQQRARRGR